MDEKVQGLLMWCRRPGPVDGRRRTDDATIQSRSPVNVVWRVRRFPRSAVGAFCGNAYGVVPPAARRPFRLSRHPVFPREEKQF